MWVVEGAVISAAMAFKEDRKVEHVNTTNKIVKRIVVNNTEKNKNFSFEKQLINLCSGIDLIIGNYDLISNVIN